MHTVKIENATGQRISLMTEPCCEEIVIEPSRTAVLTGNLRFEKPVFEDGVFHIVLHDDGGFGINVYVPDDAVIGIEEAG